MNTLAKVKPDSMPTPKQLEALRHIYRFEKKHDRFPNQRELSALMGLSENGAQGHLRALEERGFLTPTEIVRVQKITAKGLEWVKP